MIVVSIVFFFKQKTAYEMRISDWSSDVCSSDLAADDDGSVCWRIIMRTTRNIARNGLIGAIAIGLAATMGSAAYVASDRTEVPTTVAVGKSTRPNSSQQSAPRMPSSACKNTQR